VVEAEPATQVAAMEKGASAKQILEYLDRNVFDA
jgi:hypothetical protein